MGSPGVCATRGTSHQGRASRAVLISMNVLATLVAKMLSVRTPREDIGASARQDCPEIPTLPVRERLKLSSALFLNLAPAVSSAPKENVFAREGSRERLVACVGTWTSVLKQQLRKNLPVV